jgi:hypothetical protein
MDEEELDSWMHSRPFKSEDAGRAELEAGRLTALGVALWGRTSADLQRQLLAPHPEIPHGVDLDELRKLQRSAQEIVDALNDSRRPWLHSLARTSAIISVGNQRFTEWEARLEIVRRAIDRFAL